jgi:hypothetical protein
MPMPGPMVSAYNNRTTCMRLRGDCYKHHQGQRDKPSDLFHCGCLLAKHCFGVTFDGLLDVYIREKVYKASQKSLWVQKLFLEGLIKKQIIISAGWI